MKIRKLFKTKTSVGSEEVSKKYGGLIKQLDLDSFWSSLTEDERSFIRRSCKHSFGITFPLSEVDAPESQLKTRRDTSSFLIGCAAWAIEGNKYGLAEKLLLTSIDHAQDITSVHSAYHWLIKMHDHLRVSNIQSTKDCIVFCKSDIEILPLLQKELYSKGRSVQRVISINVLLSIYKELGLKEEFNELYELGSYYDAL
ncbi:hypothetical protein IMZ08_05375 [Bacillus luteolus]|uniref:Uncharacterized protein n=1 Tax=Litchfieldia luteola TaxID=682179 RepID=A0ABR9QG75_9BACI|nr:hypothetical protein [Cytobacillus luteolus]MBE4907494.1 hypothetical protein [Cytobacillus luteolus]MBP1944262.1 hypothetical protein [Cytobacillus luteolus]